MRTTKAYIASAGTAAVMLAASLSLFAMVSALVAFGAWPGASSYQDVDEVLVRTLESPKAKAVKVDANARSAPKIVSLPTVAGGPTVVVPRVTTGSPSPVTPQRQTASTPQAGAAPTAPAPSKDPVRTAPQTLGETTEQVTQQVTQQVGEVQQQVNDVIQEVGGQVGGSTGQTVQNAGDALLGG